LVNKENLLFDSSTPNVLTFISILFNFTSNLFQSFGLLILDEAVLAIARMYRMDALALPDEEDLLKANRHTSYHQFIVWQHGRLRAGVRMVIPSCCVWTIRTKFPDPFGQYTGFIPSVFIIQCSTCRSINKLKLVILKVVIYFYIAQN